jgi:hypothetical protein
MLMPCMEIKALSTIREHSSCITEPLAHALGETRIILVDKVVHAWDVSETIQNAFLAMFMHQQVNGFDYVSK